MGIISLVGGLVGLILSIVNFLTVSELHWFALILGLIGIIFGAIGMKKQPEKKGPAVAGLVLGIIALVFGIIGWVACSAAKSAVNELVDSDALESALDELENLGE